MVELHLDQRRVRDHRLVSQIDAQQTSHWGAGITAEQMGEIVWVRPSLVVQLAFTEWTEDGNLRHARFVGVRTDKPARKVRRER